MEPLTEARIRASLINCSKGEASRIKMPPGLAGLPWDDLDFLGWSDPGAPLRSVIVLPGPAGVTPAGPIGVAQAGPGVAAVGTAGVAQAGTLGVTQPGPVGVVLRRPESKRTAMARSSMCRVCLTQHSSDGVTLFVAPLAGAAGRNGNSVGEYICSDLACSLYLRGKKQPRGRLVRQEESLSLAERVDRAMTNLNGFVKRVAG